jgi:hypothetical protein
MEQPRSIVGRLKLQGVVDAFPSSSEIALLPRERHEMTERLDVIAILFQDFVDLAGRSPELALETEGEAKQSAGWPYQRVIREDSCVRPSGGSELAVHEMEVPKPDRRLRAAWLQLERTLQCHRS